MCGVGAHFECLCLYVCTCVSGHVSLEVVQDSSVYASSLCGNLKLVYMLHVQYVRRLSALALSPLLSQGTC